MAERSKVNVWYDEEGDYLDVTWGTGKTYYTETEDDRVMALVDLEGTIQGFKIGGLSTIKGAPLNVDLTPARPKNTPEEMEHWKQPSRERDQHRQK
jgi:hypothetical protein